MADPNTKGVETSEHSNLKSVQKWLRSGAAALEAGIGMMLQQEMIPKESSWIAILGMVVTALGWFTGEVIASNVYTKARTALKAEKAKAGNG